MSPKWIYFAECGLVYDDVFDSNINSRKRQHLCHPTDVTSPPHFGCWSTTEWTPSSSLIAINHSWSRTKYVIVNIMKKVALLGVVLKGCQG